jgi:hypothetical protein
VDFTFATGSWEVRGTTSTTARNKAVSSKKKGFNREAFNREASNREASKGKQSALGFSNSKGSWEE